MAFTLEYPLPVRSMQRTRLRSRFQHGQPVALQGQRYIAQHLKLKEISGQRYIAHTPQTSHYRGNCLRRTLEASYPSMAFLPSIAMLLCIVGPMLFGRSSCDQDLACCLECRFPSQLRVGRAWSRSSSPRRTCTMACSSGGCTRGGYQTSFSTITALGSRQKDPDGIELYTRFGRALYNTSRMSAQQQGYQLPTGASSSFGRCLYPCTIITGYQLDPTSNNFGSSKINTLADLLLTRSAMVFRGNCPLGQPVAPGKYS